MIASGEGEYRPEDAACVRGESLKGVEGKRGTKKGKRVCGHGKTKVKDKFYCGEGEKLAHSDAEKGKSGDNLTKKRGVTN